MMVARWLGGSGWLCLWPAAFKFFRGKLTFHTCCHFSPPDIYIQAEIGGTWAELASWPVDSLSSSKGGETPRISN